MLEEGSFRDRTADFVMMFLFGGFSMVVSLLYMVILKSYRKTNTYIYFLPRIIVLCVFRQPIIFGTSLYHNDRVHMGPEKSTYKNELFWPS